MGLDKRIEDPKFISLIRCLMKTPMKVEGVLVPTKVGVTQGSPLRPVLANIVLHELDEFCSDLSRRLNERRVISKAAVSPQYRHFTNRRHYLRQKIKGLPRSPEQKLLTTE